MGTQHARQSKQIEKRDQGSLQTFLTFLIVIGCFVIYHYVALPKLTDVDTEMEIYAGAARGIVVVDSQAVIEAFTSKMQAEIAAGASFTEGELKVSGSDFGAEYMRAIKKYRDAGYLVLDKRQSLGVPRGSEITAEIGGALDLDVVVKPDIFSAPEMGR